LKSVQPRQTVPLGDENLGFRVVPEVLDLELVTGGGKSVADAGAQARREDDPFAGIVVEILDMLLFDLDLAADDFGLGGGPDEGVLDEPTNRASGRVDRGTVSTTQLDHDPGGSHDFVTLLFDVTRRARRMGVSPSLVSLAPTQLFH
jgi:hypothetical protein